MKLSYLRALITRTCCIAGMVLLVFAVGSFAQARKQTGKVGNQLRQGQDPPPETKQGAPNKPNAQNRPNIPEGQLNRLIFEKLDLTQDQRQRIRIINRDTQQSIQQANQEVKRRQRALEDTIYADGFDEAVYNQRLSELADAQAAAVKLRFKRESALRQVLTPEQVREFRKLREIAQAAQGTNMTPDGGAGVP
jgi:Spy/CpxP family protein refolding chaperone